MSLKRLLKIFNCHPRARIEVDEVRQGIISLTNGTTIEFIEFEETEYPFIVGMMEEREVHLGWDDESTRVGYVYTRSNLSEAEYRFVAVKEMIHMLDPECDKTNTVTDIKTLSEEIVLPAELEAVSKHGLRDKMALLLALAVLIPATTRAYYKEKLDKNLITIDEVAEELLLPRHHVNCVMSNAWEIVSKNILEPYIEKDEDYLDAA